MKKMPHDLEDELLIRAFDVDEEMPIPDDYILDDIDAQSAAYIKQVQKERQLIESMNEKLKKSDSIEFEYSLNVDNSSKIKEKYSKLNISSQWINEIKREFIHMKNTIDQEINGSKYISQHTHSHPHSKKLNFQEIVNLYKINKENRENIPIPTDLILIELYPQLTNKITIKLLSYFENLLNSNNQIGINEICLWIYYLLLMLKTPLIDNDNSVLYSINKNIRKMSNFDSLINLKIIHVILSEIFSQKLINL